MKRRKAIQNIAILSGSIALLPACNASAAWPVYENIPLEPDQQKFIQWLCQAIIPKGAVEISTPEPRHHFVLRMVNDCYLEKDAEKYLRGLKLMQQHILDEYNMTFDKLNPQQQMLLFTEVQESDIFPKRMQHFLGITKQLCVRHFTSSEYFLKNHLKFNFIPGPYKGRVRV